jgi:hypothetical protein
MSRYEWRKDRSHSGRVVVVVVLVVLVVRIDLPASGDVSQRNDVFCRQCGVSAIISVVLVVDVWLKPPLGVIVFGLVGAYGG